jgi:peptidoglycan/xylan/chitin deacetylase (PgdA/CDA1 family)
MLGTLLSLLYRVAHYKQGEYPLSVLYYHHVFKEKNVYHPDVLTAKQFKQQIRLLTSYFHVLSLSEAIQHLNQKTLPAKALVITFDDGYQDNAIVAAPILTHYQCPATFFIATQGVEQGVLWNDKLEQAIAKTTQERLILEILDQPLSLLTENDKVQAFQLLANKLKYYPDTQRKTLIEQITQQLDVTHFKRTMLTKAQLQSLHQQGFEIGAHTHSHTILTTEQFNHCELELTTNKHYLEAVLQTPIKYFAYPNGSYPQDFTHEHGKLCKKLGFEAAFSTVDGGATSDTNRFAIPRFMPYRKQPFLFSLSIAKIAGEHD